MDSGFYAACAGLVARTQSLELAANNLANTSTTGYRKQQETFQQVFAGRVAPGALNRAVNAFGVLGNPATDFSQGSLQKTGNSLDFAIEGKAFFAVQTAAGIRYTRDGSFHLAADRTLLSAAGDPILGVQGPIRLPQGEPTVSSDGTISMEGALAGRFRLVEFDPGTEFTPSGNSYYTAPGGAGTAARNAQVRQGMVENSNVQPVEAAVSLIAIQRHAEMLNRTLSIFHNQFNRIAASELSRV